MLRLFAISTLWRCAIDIRSEATERLWSPRDARSALTRDAKRLSSDDDADAMGEEGSATASKIPTRAAVRSPRRALAPSTGAHTKGLRSSNQVRWLRRP